MRPTEQSDSSVLVDDEEDEQASQGLLSEGTRGVTTMTSPYAQGLTLPDPRMPKTGHTHVGGVERSAPRNDPVENTGGPQETTLVPRMLAEDGVAARLNPQEETTRSVKPSTRHVQGDPA